MYITFMGTQANAILSSFGLNQSSLYQWDQESQLQSYAARVLNSISSDRDVSELDVSGDTYRFLILLKKHGRVNNLPSISNAIERLKPVLTLMEKRYGDADLGLELMASEIGISPRHLNTMFKQTFRMTAYVYLIMFRIRKAKGKDDR